MSTTTTTTQKPVRSLGKLHLSYLQKIAAVNGLLVVATKPVFDKTLQPRPAYVAEIQLVELEDGRTVFASRRVTSTQANNLTLKRTPSVRGQVYAAIRSLIELVQGEVMPELCSMAMGVALKENSAKPIRRDRYGNLGLQSVVALRKLAEKRGLTLSIVPPVPDDLNREQLVQQIVLSDDENYYVDSAIWPYFPRMRQGDRKRRHAEIMQLTQRVKAMPKVSQ